MAFVLRSYELSRGQSFIDFLHEIVSTDYQCGAFKINCVVNTLPNFDCLPNEFDESSGIDKVRESLVTYGN